MLGPAIAVLDKRRSRHHDSIEQLVEPSRGRKCAALPGRREGDAADQYPLQDRTRLRHGLAKQSPPLREPILNHLGLETRHRLLGPQVVVDGPTPRFQFAEPTSPL
jgi:hypothetical protein